MKTRLAALLLLAATLNAFAAAPSSPTALENIPCGYPVSKVNLTQNVAIERGTSVMTVLRLLGTPSRKLSPDVWVYPGYHPEVPDSPAARSCDSLIVTFGAGTVNDLKIVNLRATQVIAANLKRAATAVQVATK
jgi:hypothetical protein